MYLQAGQSYVQQVPPLHIMDPHNVCIKDLYIFVRFIPFFFLLFYLICYLGGSENA